MPDLRAVVPAVLLGEVAPADSSDQNEGPADAVDSVCPNAAISDNSDADPGENSAQACMLCCMHRSIRTQCADIRQQ